jgi:hypothetical protein
MGLLVIVPHRRPSTADQLRNLHRQIPRLRIVCCRPATVQSSPVTSRWASPDVVRVFYSGSSGTVLGNVSSRRPSGRRRVDAARRLPTKLGAGQPVRSADAWSRRLPRQCLHSEDRPKVVNVRSSNLSTRSSRCRGGRECRSNRITQEGPKMFEKLSRPPASYVPARWELSRDFHSAETCC